MNRMEMTRPQFHSVQGGYVCEMCKATFRTGDEFHKHLKLLKCSSMNTLQQYLRQKVSTQYDHGTAATYVCGNCGQNYSSGPELELHLSSRECSQALDQYPCGICKLIFNSETEIATHINTVHARPGQLNRGPHKKPVLNTETHANLNEHKTLAANSGNVYKDRNPIISNSEVKNRHDQLDNSRNSNFVNMNESSSKSQQISSQNTTISNLNKSLNITQDSQFSHPLQDCSNKKQFKDNYNLNSESSSSSDESSDTESELSDVSGFEEIELDENMEEIPVRSTNNQCSAIETNPCVTNTSMSVQENGYSDINGLGVEEASVKIEQLDPKNTCSINQLPVNTFDNHPQESSVRDVDPGQDMKIEYPGTFDDPCKITQEANLAQLAHSISSTLARCQNDVPNVVFTSGQRQATTKCNLEGNNDCTGTNIESIKSEQSYFSESGIVQLPKTAFDSDDLGTSVCVVRPNQDCKIEVALESNGLNSEIPQEPTLSTEPHENMEDSETRTARSWSQDKGVNKGEKRKRSSSSDTQKRDYSMDINYQYNLGFESEDNDIDTDDDDNDPDYQYKEDSDYEDGADYQCNVCKRKFTTASSLTNHMKTHVSKRKTDKVCKPDENTSKSSVEDNSIAPTPSDNKVLGENDNDYQCSVCNRSFGKLSSLKNHLKTHIKLPEKVGKVNTVNKPSNNSSNLINTKLPFENKNMCVDLTQDDNKLLGQKGKDSITNITHELSVKKQHMNKENNTAMVGGKKVLSAYEIHRHLEPSCTQPSISKQVCEPDTEFICGICKLYCKTSTELNEHIANHMPSSSFVCKVCNRAFMTFPKLQLHKKVHAHPDEEQFLCGLCSHAFNTTQALQEHMYTHAKKNSNNQQGNTQHQVTSSSAGLRDQRQNVSVTSNLEKKTPTTNYVSTQQLSNVITTGKSKPKNSTELIKLLNSPGTNSNSEKPSQPALKGGNSAVSKLLKYRPPLPFFKSKSSSQ